VLRLSDTASNTDVWYLDILYGDVLFCEGQSNMDLGVSYIVNSTAEAQIANEYGNLVRILRVPLQAFSTFGAQGAPMAELLAVIPWAAAANTSVWQFSAECWLTARNLASALRIPIGAIQSDWPGDSIAMLSSPAAVAQCTNSELESSRVVEDNGLTFPGPIPGPHLPSSQWNAMGAPFIRGPLAVAAFIYHQGEADSSSGPAVFAYYKCALTALINDWKASFGGLASTAWFGVTQLAPWGDVKATVNSAGAASVRAAQLHVCRTLSNVTCAIIDDDGDPQAPAGSVHSRYKQVVAARLAAAGLRTQYGPSYANLPMYGPLYSGFQDASTAGTLSAIVSFEPDSCTGGLQIVTGLNFTSTCPVDLGIFPSACA
jgi:hypothetical protein